MAGETEEQGPQAGLGRRRHAATIDLTATEVASDQPPSADAAAEPAPVGDAPIAPSADPEPEPTVLSAQSHENAPSPEDNAAGAPPSEPPAPPQASAPTPRRARPGFLPVFGAGLAGGALVLLVGAGLWLKVLKPNGEELGIEHSARIAALELQVRDLSDHANTAPAAEGASALAERVAKLEAAPSAPRGGGSDAAVGTRLGAAEAAQKSLGDQVAGLERRIETLTAGLRETRERADAAAQSAATQTAVRADAAVEKAEFDRLAARMTALETATKSLQAELAKPPAPPADRVARLAVLAAALKNAVDRGKPFTAELAALKPLVDANRLAPLEPFAAQGVPRAPALSRELSMLAPAMMRGANTGSAEHGVLERLQAHAERLIRIRPVSEVQGDDSGAVIARMELRASQGDVVAALTEIAKLPDAARAPAEEWIKRANAREAAVSASDRIAGDAFAALAKAGS